MAKGGSLMVPRWSIRVSLTTLCLSQSMYTLICDDLTFLGWISAHISCPGLGIVQIGRICRFSTFRFPKTRFYRYTKLWRRIQSLDLKLFVFVSGGMIRRQNDIWYGFSMSLNDSILDRGTKLRHASSHTWRICRRSKWSLLFEDTFFNHMTIRIYGKLMALNETGNFGSTLCASASS